MSTFEIFQAVQDSSFGHFIGHQSHWVGAVVQMFHIAGLISLLAGILLVSLRLLGVGLHTAPLTRLASAATPLIATGAVLLLVSGLFIFIPSATLYAPNPAFWAKVVLLLAALIVHFTLYRKATASDSPNPTLARFAGVLSISLWFSVGFAGRAIGFM
ncbi:MAG: hypothetical protein QM776_10850 [Rhodocyclaceae bacterium]